MDVQIPLISRRRERGKLIQKFQHAVPAVPLLGAGIQGLMHGERGFALALAVAEIVTSALLLRSMGKELKEFFRHSHESDHHRHHGVDWFEIFAAGMLAVEALERWHTHPHLPRPMFLSAVVTLVLGLTHGRTAAAAARPWSLVLDSEGIRVGGRRLQRRFSVAWQDLERIDLDDRRAVIVARDGRKKKINLRDLRNAAEVREALMSARARLMPQQSVV